MPTSDSVRAWMSEPEKAPILDEPDDLADEPEVVTDEQIAKAVKDSG